MNEDTVKNIIIEWFHYTCLNNCCRKVIINEYLGVTSKEFFVCYVMELICMLLGGKMDRKAAFFFISDCTMI